jgi:hypothetical protein
VRLWRAATAELIPASYGTKLVPTAQLPFDLCIAESSFAREDVLIAPAAAFATVECPCDVQALNAGHGSAGGAGNNGVAPIVTEILLLYFTVSTDQSAYETGWCSFMYPAPRLYSTVASGLTPLRVLNRC